MREALAILRRIAPDLEVDGEMQADSALTPAVRDRLLPGSTLTGAANLLVMPSLDAASAAYNLLKAVTGAITIGPILIGPTKPAHIVNSLGHQPRHRQHERRRLCPRHQRRPPGGTRWMSRARRRSS